MTSTLLAFLSLKEGNGGSPKYYQVVDKRLADLDVDSNFKSSTVLLMGGNPSVSVVPGLKRGDPNPPCESLTIQYKGSRIGTTINFSSFLSNSRGITGTEALSIVMRKFKDKDGLYHPQFVIANAGSEWGNPNIDPK